MQSLYDVPAPAKLNLFLHVIGRRADGYHMLQSAFALIDWCDTLHFQSRRDGVISREDMGVALPAHDLTVRAAQALQSATGTPLGAHISLQKRIPTEAGLGGGSSDAASCLLALNHLWGLRLPLSRLSAIGLPLGADVPFFLAGRNAWVEGIGEKMTPLVMAAASYLVVKPPDGLQTSRVFSDPDLKRDSDTAIISGFAASPTNYGRNDLQAVAQRLCPGVSQALDWLACQGLDGRMTGSGSAVFASLQGDIALRAMPDGFVVRRCDGLDVHPLFGWAQR